MKRSINGHTMAIRAIEGKPQPTKIWKGRKVDAGLEDEWLEDLNNIKGIEIISICGGHDKRRPAHIVFYPKRQDKSIKNFLSRIKEDGWIWAIEDKENRGGRRICIASKSFAGTESRDNWWVEIAAKIKTALEDL